MRVGAIQKTPSHLVGEGREGREGGRMPWTPNNDRVRQRSFVRAAKRAKVLRAEATGSERALWKLLRMLNREGAHFRRQAPIGPYVYDFADLSARLLIELDGGVHALANVALRDEAKTAWALSQSFRLLRLTNREVWSSPDATIDEVRAALPAPPSPLVGEGREGGRSAAAPHTERPPPLAPPHEGEGK